MQRVLSNLSIVLTSISISFFCVQMACNITSDEPNSSRDSGQEDVFQDGSFSNIDAEETRDVLTLDGMAETNSKADCLVNTDVDHYFHLYDPTKCVVARYVVEDMGVARYGVNEIGLSSLTWGRHQGPMMFDTKKLDVLRFELPLAHEGQLTLRRSSLKNFLAPAGQLYWSAQAVDLPFFDWTVISYTDMMVAGEALFLDSDATKQRSYQVRGFFSATAIRSADLHQGRLFYTGLSTLGLNVSMAREGAVYAADSCGTKTNNPRLLPEGDSTCVPPTKIATWESGSSGPITRDPNQNVFAILSTYEGLQEMRGFESSAISQSATSNQGTSMIALTGYTNELAADGRAVYFQPILSARSDVIEVRYRVDAQNKTIATTSYRVFLQTKKDAEPVVLMTDPKGQLWVGIETQSDWPTSDAGADTLDATLISKRSSTVFFVFQSR